MLETIERVVNIN